MGMQICASRRLRRGWTVATAFAGAMCLAAAAAHADSDLAAGAATFAAQSHYADPLAIPPEQGALQWSSQDIGVADGARYAGIDFYRSHDNVPAFEPSLGASFSEGVHEHHGGGGRADHGDFGDGSDHGERCDSRCVITSAVPEPNRGALLLVGALAVLAFARRRRSDAGLPMAHPIV